MKKYSEQEKTEILAKAEKTSDKAINKEFKLGTSQLWKWRKDRNEPKARGRKKKRRAPQLVEVALEPSFVPTSPRVAVLIGSPTDVMAALAIFWSN